MPKATYRTLQEEKYYNKGRAEAELDAEARRAALEPMGRPPAPGLAPVPGLGLFALVRPRLALAHRDLGTFPLSLSLLPALPSLFSLVLLL